MLKARLVSGAVVLLAGIVLAVIAFIEGRYWGVAGALTAGVAWAAAIIFFEHWVTPAFWFFPVCAALLTWFSVFDVFTSSHLVNLKEAEAQRDFLQTLIELEVDPYRLTSHERRLASEAFRVCAIQGELDKMELVANSHKALYFGPALTLVDGVNSVINREQPLRCLDYYRELRKTQPQLFIKMERHNPWLKASSGRLL